MPGRTKLRRGRSADDCGFTLIEVIVSIGIVGIVMTALTTFFTTTVRVTSLQSGQQVATQLAEDAIEQVRRLSGATLATGRDKTSVDAQWASPVAGVSAYLADMQEVWDDSASVGSGADAELPTSTKTTTVNGVAYGRTFYVGKCWQSTSGGACGKAQVTGYAEFFRVVAAITWTDQRCAASACSYVTSTLVSSAAGEPTFDSNQTASQPKVNSVGTQNSVLGTPITSITLGYTGGSLPITWTVTGLPAGLEWASNGVISGTPTAACTCTVTATATDAFEQTDNTSFTWKVADNSAPELGPPGNQSSTVTVSSQTNSSVWLDMSTHLSGGAAPYTWSATNLPYGLSIDSSGKISGTLSRGTRWLSTVTVTDANGKSDAESFTWTVDPTGLEITTPSGNRTGDRVGQSTSLTAYAAGGTGWYSWSWSGLPTGVSASGATASGTPSKTGVYTVTVVARDLFNGAEATFMFTWTVS